MFMFHAAFSLGLIALTAGSALYVYSSSSNGAGTRFANIIATLVIIFSIISILCTSYYNVSYWLQGYYRNPMNMMRGMEMQDHSMMNGKDIPEKKNQ